MDSVLYVSTRRYPGDGMAEIDDILSVSRSRNHHLDVTGALVATPTHYAQMLEGSETALADVMGSIREDDRHGDLLYATLPAKPHREMSRWSLAYIGDSTFVSDLVIAAAAERDTRSFDTIRALMLMFA